MTSGPAPDLFLVALQHVERTTAHGADAQQAHLNRFGFDITSCVHGHDSVRVALAVVLEEARDADDCFPQIVRPNRKLF